MQEIKKALVSRREMLLEEFIEEDIFDSHKVDMFFETGRVAFTGFVNLATVFSGALLIIGTVAGFFKNQIIKFIGKVASGENTAATRMFEKTLTTVFNIGKGSPEFVKRFFGRTFSVYFFLKKHSIAVIAVIAILKGIEKYWTKKHLERLKKLYEKEDFVKKAYDLEVKMEEHDKEFMRLFMKECIVQGYATLPFKDLIAFVQDPETVDLTDKRKTEIKQVLYILGNDPKYKDFQNKAEDLSIMIEGVLVEISDVLKSGEIKESFLENARDKYTKEIIGKI